MRRWSVLLGVGLALGACRSENELARHQEPLAPTTTTPPECVLPEPDGYQAALTSDCHDEPAVGGFDPVVEWTWSANPTHPGYHQVMAAPAVGQLNDDDGDGDVDDDDTPDVVFAAFAGSAYGSPGALVALSGADGSQLWSTTSLNGHLPMGCSGVAIGKLDGTDPVVLVTTQDGLAAADGATGGFVWYAATERVAGGYGHPALADLDGDGISEVIFGRQAIDAQGNILWTGTGGTGGIRFNSFAVRLDADPYPEVIAGNTVYRPNGSVRWEAGADGWPAVADMNGDGSPDIVRVIDPGTIEVYDAGGGLLWTHNTPEDRGGPPTIADFDGDGEPEIGVAFASHYRVIEEAGELWAMPVSDYSSSRTGSSVFDFEGDGAAEVVYADEHDLWVFDGATGAVELRWTDHASGTLYEYPLVADVDGDGASEIVLPSNNYGRPGATGITVLGDANDSWAPARKVWNQHAYFIDHVADDGSVPVQQVQPWTWHNSFRAANPRDSVGLRRTDLVPAAPVDCSDECSVDRILSWIPVENRGEVAAQRVGVEVREDGEVVWSAEIGPIEPGEVGWAGPVELQASRFLDGPLRIEVAQLGTTPECDTSNNGRNWSDPCFMP